MEVGVGVGVGVGVLYEINFNNINRFRDILCTGRKASLFFIPVAWVIDVYSEL